MRSIPFFKKTAAVCACLGQKKSKIWNILCLILEIVNDTLPIYIASYVRSLVQLERITFRAVQLFLRTALFVCLKSDTFLMNYTIVRHGETIRSFGRRCGEIGAGVCDL